MLDYPSISVVLAAYNAKAYIRNAIEGVLAQTLSDFELLIVDDGSTDGTDKLCDEYAKNDARIRIFHEQHRGVTHARQVAICHARGKYIIRIDADDKTAPYMLEEMLYAAEEANADMLICNYWELSTKGCVSITQQPSGLSPATVANDLLEGRLFGALWNKMFRTSCIKKNNIHFHQGLDLREDIVFVLDTLPYIERIAYLPKAFYTYDRHANANSLSNTYLTENRHYYEQEILWHKAALDCPLINSDNKRRFMSGLLNYAYITLSGKFYSAEEWTAVFQPCYEMFREVGASYKRRMVLWALKGHFSSASLLRRVIALFRGTS